MKLAKKILTIVSIVTLVVAVGLLISALFGAPVFKKPMVSVLFTFAVLCAGAIFALNGLQIFSKKRTLAIVDLSFIGVLLVVGIIVIWLEKYLPNLFNQLTLILAMATIFFNIIVSNYLKMEKSKLVLQAIAYSLIIVIDILLSLQILEVNLFGISWFVKLFIVLCLVTFIMLVVLVILSKKIPETKQEKTVNVLNHDFVTISKKEYDGLLLKISNLEEELKNLKNN